MTRGRSACLNMRYDEWRTGRNFSQERNRISEYEPFDAFHPRGVGARVGAISNRSGWITDMPQCHIKSRK